MIAAEVAQALQRYVSTWLAAGDHWEALANTGSGVPRFLGWRLADGRLEVVPGDRYAAHVAAYLLVGEHRLDEASVAAALERFGSGADPVATRRTLIVEDARAFWRYGVHYPALVLLLQNQFYGLTLAQVADLVDRGWQACGLPDLARDCSEDVHHCPGGPPSQGSKKSRVSRDKSPGVQPMSQLNLGGQSQRDSQEE
ncbi:MAG: hypothetical protein ACFCBW_00925 [Candidatus Competibacterales bacterium]